MATRSTIGVELPNGKVKGVYCHWDGYPSGVGDTLLSIDFKDANEVEEFINEGDRSTVCVSYKDRGEDDYPPRIWEGVDEYFESDLENWGYVYTQNGEWLVKDMYEGIKPVPLAHYLETDMN